MSEILSLQNAYWNWTYDDFCEQLELDKNSYAENKWEAFKDMGLAMVKLGDYLPQIVERYQSLHSGTTSDT